MTFKVHAFITTARHVIPVSANHVTRHVRLCDSLNATQLEKKSAIKKFRFHIQIGHAHRDTAKRRNGPNSYTGCLEFKYL